MSKPSRVTSRRATLTRTRRTNPLTGSSLPARQHPEHRNGPSIPRLDFVCSMCETIPPAIWVTKARKSGDDLECPLVCAVLPRTVLAQDIDRLEASRPNEG